MSHMGESRKIQKKFTPVSGESIIKLRSSPMGLDVDCLRRLHR